METTRFSPQPPFFPTEAQLQQESKRQDTAINPAAAAWLETFTQFAKTENGRLWWMLTAGNVRDELTHANGWALEGSLQAVGTAGEPLCASDTLLASLARLQALLAERDEPFDNPDYSLFLHLHEIIREAALQEFEIAKTENNGASLPAPDPHISTPGWYLLHQPRFGAYGEYEHLQTFLFNEDSPGEEYSFAVSYRSVVAPNGECLAANFYFTNRAQAAAIRDLFDGRPDQDVSPIWILSEAGDELCNLPTVAEPVLQRGGILKSTEEQRK